MISKPSTVLDSTFLPILNRLFVFRHLLEVNSVNPILVTEGGYYEVKYPYFRRIKTGL